MIKYVTGNIFEANTECLVNTVNCEGYMGKGIAYQFKLKFPENNNDYVKACKSGKLHIGSIHWYFEDGILIVNFPTKDKWRERSQMHYIEVGLDQLVQLIIEKEIKSIALPPLGCGNGGLNWNDVKILIENKLESVKDNIDILIYEPSASYKVVPKEAPKLSLSGLILLQIKLHLDKFGFIRLQKTAYFMNYFLGEEYFKFDKFHYGPYSHSIDVISRSIREYQTYYNISNSKDTYDAVYKVICSKKIEQQLEKMIPAIERASRYVNEIESDKKLEGIATVLYIVKQNNMMFDQEEIVDFFKKWSEDKEKRFSEEEIMQCIDYLENTGIILKNICGLYEINII